MDNAKIKKQIKTVNIITDKELAAFQTFLREQKKQSTIKINRNIMQFSHASSDQTRQRIKGYRDQYTEALKGITANHDQNPLKDFAEKERHRLQSEIEQDIADALADRLTKTNQ